MACRSAQYSGTTKKNAPWSNWAELAGGKVEIFYEPGSLADIVGIVQDAQAGDMQVRVAGSGWAFEDNAYSSNVMVSLARLNSVLTYVTDPDAGALVSPTVSGGRRLIHVEGGIKIATLNLQLAERGLAMPTLGGANGQSIVGALSTSTHGSDFAEPPFCDLIRAVHLVGVGGREYWFERETAPITSNARLGRVLPCPDTLVVRDDEAFDAITVSLGRFGVIYSIILEVVPAYTLAQEPVLLPLLQTINDLRAGIDQGTFLDPLLMSLPAPSPVLNAVRVVPRAMQLILDSRNPAFVHVVRNWLATGPDLNMGPVSNQLCDLGAVGVLSMGQLGLVAFGMDPTAVSDPGVLADPTRPVRLTAKELELTALAADAYHMRPGEALAIVANAYWEFDITRLPDLLSFFEFQNRFQPMRGPSHAVMTGTAMYDSSGMPLPHELHNCYKANSCEIFFDAADARYIDLFSHLAGMAPTFQQAGYISLRFSARSRALLSMNNVESNNAASIEVSTFKGMNGSAAWIDHVLEEGLALGGRPHWGQQNHPTVAQIEEMYGARLDRWRAVLGGFSGASTLFSNAFTVARGLEPKGTRKIRIEGTASELSSSADAAVSMLLLDDGPPFDETASELSSSADAAISMLLLDDGPP